MDDQDTVSLASPSTTKGTINGVSPKPKAGIEIGVSNYLPFVTPYKDSWEVTRVGQKITVQQLQNMRETDGQARALYRLMTLPIRAALKTATFLPESIVEGGQDEAEFAEQLLTLPEVAGGMDVPFTRFIAQLLMALFDGFSAFELVYQSPEVGPLKGKWSLKKIAHRPSGTVTFLTDDKANFNGFHQKTMHQGRSIDVTIPKDVAIYYAAQEEECQFYGKSYFEAAFYHYDKKAKLYYIAHLAAQRAAVGTRIGKVPQGGGDKAETDKFDAALAKLGVAQSMTMPEGYSVESLKEGGGFDFLAFINHHNSQMSKSILAPFFDKDQGAGSGEAKIVDFGQQSNLLFILMLETIMGEIESIINDKIIPRFIDWNFGTGKYPKFQFGTLTEEQKGAALDLFTKVATISQAGLSCTPEFVHELEKQVADQFGLEIDYETLEKEMEEQKALQAQLGILGQQVNQDQGPGIPGTPGVTPSNTGANVVPPEILPPDFKLSESVEPDSLQLAGELLMEAAGEVLDTDELVALARRVMTPEGARRFGQPVGSLITRDTRESAQKSPKPKPGEEDPNNPRAGKAINGNVDESSPGKAKEGKAKNAKQQETNVVRRVWQNPKAPGYKIIEYADDTFALQRPDGTIGSRNSNIKPETWKSLGWLIAQAKQ